MSWALSTTVPMSSNSASRLQVILCFSPVGSILRVRARKFPAVVNCTAINWFHEWPEDALVSVSARFLEETEGIQVSHWCSRSREGRACRLRQSDPTPSASRARTRVSRVRTGPDAEFKGGGGGVTSVIKTSDVLMQYF